VLCGAASILTACEVVGLGGADAAVSLGCHPYQVTTCWCSTAETQGTAVCAADGGGYGSCACPDSGAGPGVGPDGGAERDATSCERGHGAPDACADATRDVSVTAAGDAKPDGVGDAHGVDAQQDGWCSLGAVSCDGSQPAICTASGAYEDFGNPCSGATPVCANGACVAGGEDGGG
jgi:hypothetical protein